MDKKIKILVIGGSGFIGINLINKLIDMNYKVTSFSKNIKSNKKKINKVNYLFGDIKNFSEIKNKLQNKQFDFVINLSGYGDHRSLNSGGIKVIQDHYMGSLNISKFFYKEKN